MMRLLRIAVCASVLLGCQTTGVVGDGKVRTDTPEPVVAGLTASEFDTLRVGPPPTLSGGAIDALMDRDAQMQVTVQPAVLSDKGLLALAIERAPAEVQSGIERIRERTGIDIVQNIDMLSIWGTDLDQDNGFVGAAAASKTLSARKMVEILDAVGKERGADGGSGEPTSGAGIELTLLGALPQADFEPVLTMLAQGSEETHRLDLGPGRALVVYQDRNQRFYYTYLWAQGVRLEMIPGAPAKPLEAAARRALASVNALRDLASSSSIPSTVRARVETSEGVIYAEARVDMRTALVVELPSTAIGSDENLVNVIENWDKMRPVFAQMIARNPKFQSTPNLQALLVEAIEQGKVAEAVDGLRIETEVDTDTLVEGLKELPR